MSTPTFAALGLPAPIVATLRDAGIVEPFPIQDAAVPDGLAGRDVLGRAPTGSGKTLAFGLPLLTRIGRARPHHPTALVLAPTRELAEQIRRELVPYAKAMRRTVTSVYGGVGYGQQLQRLRRGVDVLVATPGRLQDLVDRGSVRLDAIEVAVVDEADRMADMGFLPQVRKLLDLTPDGRQTIFFSATLDGDVDALTRRYQRDPVRHEVGSERPDTGDARHFFWRVSHEARAEHTADLVEAAGPTIVFCRTRRGAERLARRLARDGVAAAAIHGGRTQRQRDRALADFTRGRIDALVATDVAARGIHVDGVACVVHFDPPEDHKAYVHRSGRTARAGEEGAVVSLVTGDQVRSSRRLQHALGLSGDHTAPSLQDLSSGGERLGSHPVRLGSSRDERPADARRPTGGRGSRGRGHGSRSGGRRRAPSRGRR